MDNDERRSGKERREMPPTCETPCPPLLAQYNKIEECLREKVPMKLFVWIVGALAFFCVIIIGGAQWAIVDNNRVTAEKFLEKMAEAATLQAITAERTRAMNENLERHLRNSDVKFGKIEQQLEHLKNQNYQQHKGGPQ